MKKSTVLGIILGICLLPLAYAITVYIVHSSVLSGIAVAIIILAIRRKRKKAKKTAKR